jgi:hypothetical protein
MCTVSNSVRHLASARVLLPGAVDNNSVSWVWGWGTMQINVVVESLSGGVVELIRDLNGNHVIQRCLQRLGAERSQFVYDAACGHTWEIATHRHGCCVLQRCIDHATHTQKRQLVAEIAKNALRLSQVYVLLR